MRYLQSVNALIASASTASVMLLARRLVNALLALNASAKTANASTASVMMLASRLVNALLALNASAKTANVLIASALHLATRSKLLPSVTIVLVPSNKATNMN
jgi:phage gp46-like protein